MGKVSSQLFWMGIKAVITLICVMLINMVMEERGYYMPFRDLLLVAVVTIVGVRIWDWHPKD